MLKLLCDEHIGELVRKWSNEMLEWNVEPI